MTPETPLPRVAALALGAIAVLAGCSSQPPSADERLCAEVERVAAELVELDQPIEDAQDVRILASHLVVAATGDPDGTPSRELARTVRAAGMDGSATATPDLFDGLVTSYEACEDAGIAMDRSPLDTLAER